MVVADVMPGEVLQTPPESASGDIVMTIDGNPLDTLTLPRLYLYLFGLDAAQRVSIGVCRVTNR